MSEDSGLTVVNMRTSSRRKVEQPSGARRQLGSGEFSSSRRRQMSLSSRATVILASAIVVFILVWQLVSAVGWIDPLFVSSPTGVLGAALTLSSDQATWASLGQTGAAIAVAFVIAAIFGTATGLLIGLFPLVRDAYFGTISYLMATPKVVFVPIFLVLFGIGPVASAAFGAFEAYFYVAVSVVGGVGLVEARYLRIVRAFKGNFWFQFIDVVLPAASPGIFAGLWYGIKHAFLGVFIVELYASANGLGKLIHLYTEQLETDKVLALVLTVTVVAVILGSMWNKFESYSTRWRPDPTGSATFSIN